jgi:WD40 repeat protein
MVKDYGAVFKNCGVSSMTITPDNKYLFVGGYEGNLKQFSLESQQVVHDYGLIHEDLIFCLETTRDSKWLYTGSYDRFVIRISIENRQVDEYLGPISRYGISAMKITADEKKLLVEDNLGHLKLLSLRNGELIKDYGCLFAVGGITGIVITADQKFLFTSSSDNVLKQWNYEDITLVRDYGKITNKISSLCI